MATCSTAGGVPKCVCPAGMEDANGANGGGKVCRDRNECAATPSPCNANATCTNTVGSFGCACNPGYAGTGTACADVDECELSSDNCDGLVSAAYGGRNNVVARPVIDSSNSCVAFSSNRTCSGQQSARFG